MSRYRKNYADEDGENLEDNTNPKGGDPTSTGAPESEEESWKKRHGDLRRYAQHKEQELTDRIRKLEEQLATKDEAPVKLPKTKEEVEAFMRRYPDIGGVIETIAEEKALKMSGKIEGKLSRVQELEERIKQKDLEAIKEKAYRDLLAAHPDFDTLKNEEKFQKWIESASKWVQEALWVNDVDAGPAIDAVTLYKTQNRGSSSNRQKEVSDASSVRSGRASPPSGGSDAVFSESMIAGLSDAEYERLEPQIMKARREGKFVFDLSGAA